MANTYLSRTFGSGNQQIWTWSGWIKRNKLGTDQQIFGRQLDGSNIGAIRFQSDDAIRVNNNTGGTGVELYTTMKFRDTNGWYHLVVVFKGAESTASDRVDIYVNGEEIDFTVTSLTTAGNGYINGSGDHFIGKRAPADNDRFLEAVLSHVHFIDGTAYTPSAFGETDANGVWTIKTSPSVTYGTNGFFILKDGNSVTDQSGNGNNFTVGGGTLTKTEDCPSNVFPTINPLTYSTTKWNLEYGNLRTNGLFSGESAGYRSVYGTLGASSGKYYFEMKVTRTYSVDPNYIILGIIDAEQMEYAGDNGKFFDKSRGYGYRGVDGNKQNGGVGTSYGDTFTTNDIIGCAFDLDNHKIYWSKNGVWQNSGDPTSGATGTGSAYDLATGYTYLPAVCHFYDDDRIEFNFGNGYFGTTAVSSAGTNASGIGIFEYDVPTGYTALSTKGLNL